MKKSGNLSEPVRDIDWSLEWSRIEWFIYILKRAVSNKEPLTAWDACASLMSLFDRLYGIANQSRVDDREMDEKF